ncbi:Zn(II)2Cys6 transcription factor [Aspergillus saccharolyticus JOP 1030-1]|uniref:C6 zinc finger domain protein n=1 Tax=Aspergillus saccharolyticus JOP 1030-1 TaxID=1450539 RepID=A0A318Z6S4_9EURO|nr:C6 zinc finger domain protein [Aspergillus saccharolyticus JOP 1030-1]PYH42846.1 C6 zinc finger domain protein [Aspergillus saccharolyticus JOP 1030-1]
MADAESPAQVTGWRIAKACQECRKRKIKCNGVNPCKTCQLRGTPCVYREVIRQRKRRYPYPERSNTDTTSTRLELNGATTRADESHPAAAQPLSLGATHPPPRRRNPSVSLHFNNSVSATHMTSPSCKVQLYYGSTSHFALMHEIYRGLVANNHSAEADRPPGEVEEAGAGLDMFSFRRIFFGTPIDSQEVNNKSPTCVDSHLLFLPYELAKCFLERFLATLYNLAPVWPHEEFYRQLEHLYGQGPDARPDKGNQSILLVAMAIGALATQHYTWGDALYDRVKISMHAFDDVHAHYQSEQGRPNSSFLHMGTAVRKAISAGLHKEAPSESGEAANRTEERRVTFWSLFFYEVWTCFHLGRPSSLSVKDVSIALPEDAFLQVLVSLGKIVARSACEMYGRRHESLLQMWKIARSIIDELRGFDGWMKRALGFGLDKSAQPGSLGVRQTILTTLYCHTILLTFRPFLIFRGRWHQDMKRSSRMGSGKKASDIPSWLNEACNQALSAACRTIQHLCEASAGNDLVRELRYHGYFLGHSSFALMYDLMHGENLAPTHLPWIHAAVQDLSTMRPGDPIKSSIDAIQTVLRKLHPSYEWVPPELATKNPVYDSAHTPPIQPPRQAPHASSHGRNRMPMTIPGDSSISSGLPMLSVLQGNSLQDDMRLPSGSVGSGDDLLDFTQSDMGWDFDFSTMDLEAFFSINANIDPMAF